MYKILFVGAHHDDIEIGAGGTLSKFIDKGYDVSAMILTDDVVDGSIDIRRKESISSLGNLGLSINKIHFANFKDGYLAENKDTVSSVRSILRERNLAPDIVICHTDSDSHNDHRACGGIITSSFRESVILRYPIVNHLITSSFNPHLYIDTSDFYEVKCSALKRHTSQEKSGRILWDQIREHEASYGQRIGSTYAEGFEIVVQAGGEKKEEVLFKLNESPFHKLWWYLIKNEELYYIHSLPRIDSSPNIINWIPNNDRLGAALLRENLVRNYNYRGFFEIPSSHPGIDKVMEKENILLGGGPVNNIVTRNYFDHFPGIRYRVDYDMPGYKSVRIQDLSSHNQIIPKYINTSQGMRKLQQDYGILTIMKNIACRSSDKILVGCMGTHGFGAYGCYRILTEYPLIMKILHLFKLPLVAKNIVGYQILFKVNPQTEELLILEDSIHSINYTEG